MMFFLCNSALAFSDSDTIKYKYSLGITPSAIMNSAIAFQLSHKINLYKRFSFGLETGYIFSNLDMNDENVRGLRLRPQLHFTVYNKYNTNVDLYAFYNYRYYKTDRFVTQIRANGAYTEKLKGNKENILKGFGFGFDLGFSNNLTFLNKLTLGAGLGVGSVENIYSDPVFIPFDWFSFSGEGEFRIPIIIFHLNFQLF
jgi:hypothetical protein